MRHCLLLFLCFVLSVCKAQTQCEINGKVIDTNEKPLYNATIRMLKTDSSFVKGVKTDSVGAFLVELENKGNYILYVTAIGYADKIINVSALDDHNKVKDIVMTEDKNVLDEVVVTGSAVRWVDDHYAYHLDEQQKKHSRTGYDVLYNLMIPGVMVDRRSGTATTIGGEVTLYINGRKADNREIQNLRTRNIERIEYYDLPSGTYAGDVASINYVVKEIQSGGYVSADAEQIIGYLHGDYNVAAKIDKGNTVYNVFAGHKQSRYHNSLDDVDETFRLQENTIYKSLRLTDNLVRNNAQYAQAKALNSTDKRTLSAKLAFVRSASPNNTIENTLTYSDYGNAQSARQSTDDRNIMTTLELYGKFNIAKNQWIEATVNGSISDNRYGRLYDEGTNVFETDVNEDFYSLTPSLQYHINMPHKNSLTVQLMHAHKVSSTHYLGTSPSWQHLWSGETLLFVTYDQTLSDRLMLILRGGVSTLQYRLHGFERTTQVSPRGNLMLSYKLSDSQRVGISANLGNAYPEISTLNNATQEIDRFHFRRGNPEADRITMCGFQAMHNLTQGRFNLFTIFMYEAEINSSMPFYFEENGRLGETYRHEDNYHLFRLGTDLSWKVTDALRIQLSGRWLHGLITGDDDVSVNSVFGRFNASYYWKDFSFNIFGNTKSKGLGSDRIVTTTDGKYGMYITWNHGNLSAEIGANNLFLDNPKITKRIDTRIYSYNRTVCERISQQAAYIKLAYTLDFGKKTQKDWNDVNRTINSAILKAE